jgi:hypothetical protein
VYTPVFETIPTAAFPPATPFTLQVTLLLLALATAAAKTCEFPNNRSALVGVTVTLTEAGGVLGDAGVVGCAKPDPNALHPAIQITAASTTGKVAVLRYADSTFSLR